MCGIAGGWLPEGLPRETLAAALEKLVHRGPDDEGTLFSGKLFLGMRRLSIIDLEGGAQPLFNEDRSVAVICNGEIYNFRELHRQLVAEGHRFRTRSDVEVLAHLYEREGTELCGLLRGMYAFAIWDFRNETLLLARDRFGKKPLYYTCTPSGGLLFASELKALRPLAAAAGISWQIRNEGIYNYLSLGVIPQPDTIYRRVLALPPASLLSFRGGRLRINTYWQLKQVEDGSIPYADAVEQIRERIAQAVQLRLRSDVPLGVFLSGGIDSSIVAYEAARHVGQQLHTFTIAADDPGIDESGVAARTATFLGVNNTVLPLRVMPLCELERLVKLFDQPFADSSAIPSLAISRLARERVKVVLNGDGGDEIFAGYRRYLAAHFGQRLGKHARTVGVAAAKMLPAARTRRSRLGFAARLARGLGQEPAGQYLTWTPDMLVECDKRDFWRQDPVRPTETWIESVLKPELSPLRRQLDADIHINLLSDLLVKMDMASMAASLEARSPLLDHDVAEFATRLPDASRLRRGTLKAVLRDAYRGRLPDEVIKAPKRGFEVPLENWLENDMRALIGDTLGARTARVNDYVHASAVSKLLDRKILRDRNWAYLVYSLLVLELWLRKEA